MTQIEKKKAKIYVLGNYLSQYFPDLKKTLMLADLKKSPAEFLESVAVNAAVLSYGALILTLLIYSNFRPAEFLLGINIMYVVYGIILLVVYKLIFFNYLMLYPAVMKRKRQREIDHEIVFAGRHLVIAFKSGMPLFPAILSLSTGYGQVSKEFSRISEKVSLGTPLIQAIRDVANTTPSQYLTRILLQISNSLSSGADIGTSLESVLNQISKEQVIQLKEYGQKLTPLVMFFMMFGIIIPAIGIVCLIVLSTVISAGQKGLSPMILSKVFIVVALLQYLFFGIIESSRPRYLL